MGRNFVLTPDKKKLRFFCETSETYEDGKPFTCSEDFEIAQNDPDDEGAVDTGLGCDRDEKQVSQAHGSELAAVATEATTTQTVATTLLPQLGSIFSVPCTNCDEVNTLNKEELKLIGRKKFTEHVKQTNNNCFHSTGVVNVNTLWYIYILYSLSYHKSSWMMMIPIIYSTPWNNFCSHWLESDKVMT